VTGKSTISSRFLPDLKGGIITLSPYEFFLDRNNTMYVTNEQNNQLVVWYKENNSPANIISGNLNGPSNLFVTT